MWFITALMSAVIFGLAGFMMKVSQMKKSSLPHMLFALYLIGTIGFIINGTIEHSLNLSDYRIWIGGLFIAIGSAGGNYLFMKAFEYGPASLTSPLVNMNIVLVILMSIIIFGEKLTALQWLGIAVLISVVVMISYRRSQQTVPLQKLWFLFVFSAMIIFTFRNGGLKVTDDLGLNNTMVLLAGYFLATLWFISVLLLSKTKSDPQSVRAGFLWGGLAGLFSYGGMQLYSTALQTGPASIVAPIFATNSLVVVIGSIFIFHERLTTLQKWALLLLLFGLVLVRFD